MQRALILCVSMLAISGAAVADEAAAPLTAAVVDVKKPIVTTVPARHAPARGGKGLGTQAGKSAGAQAGASTEPASDTSPTDTPASDTSAGEAPGARGGAKPPGDVQMSGMSVLGNDDSPKSLVLVPWKTSQLGDAPSLSKLLDDSTQPVDKDVFMRELAYYQIKTDSK